MFMHCNIERLIKGSDVAYISCRNHVFLLHCYGMKIPSFIAPNIGPSFDLQYATV